MPSCTKTVIGRTHQHLDDCSMHESRPRGSGMALGRGFFAFLSAAACWRAKNERFVVTSCFQLPLNLSRPPVGFYVGTRI